MSTTPSSNSQTTLPLPAGFPPPSQGELVMKVIPMPSDVNANGDIFGGWVMAQVDLAGSVLPARHVKGRMATVAVNEFVFKQPVKVGDLLSFFAVITKVGRTSITVKVQVFAERLHAYGGRVTKVTEAFLTYVAVSYTHLTLPTKRIV